MTVISQGFLFVSQPDRSDYVVTFLRLVLINDLTDSWRQLKSHRSSRNWLFNIEFLLFTSSTAAIHATLWPGNSLIKGQLKS